MTCHVLLGQKMTRRANGDWLIFVETMMRDVSTGYFLI